MRTSRKILLLLLLILGTVAIAAWPSVAQTEPRIGGLRVDLWPEYDRPEMLIVYRGVLPSDLAVPATLSLRIPARVAQPHAVAYQDEAGDLFEAEYSTTATAEWLIVTLETPVSNFQLEFYDALTYEGAQHSYTFNWPGDYAVDQLDLFLLPPSGATDIQTEPALTFIESDSGSPGYVGALGSLAAGQESEVMVSYNAAAVTANEPISLSTDTDEDTNYTPAIVLIVMGTLALVIGATLWYTRRPITQPSEVPPTPKRRAKGQTRASRKRPKRREPSPTNRCAKCGRPLRAEDRFCGGCGTPV